MTRYTGRAIDAAYVEARGKWEPLYEWTQIKGDGETHPLLSPDDAFADYETWDLGNLDLTELKTPAMLPFEYAREALKNGLLLESRLGTNPYKFGSVGSTDAHTSLTAIEEDNFFGKSASSEPSPERMHHPFVKSRLGAYMDYELAAAGLTGVWATENTREAIWDAMARKEVYATTGPRMMVALLRRLGLYRPGPRQPPAGVPRLREGRADGRRPAGKDRRRRAQLHGLRAPGPVGGNLDRIQIVKGWLDAAGATHEQVYDVAWSPGREPDADGKLPLRRQHGRRRRRELDQHHRCLRARRRLDRPGFRPGRVAPSTTPACSRSRPRAGSPTTRSATASRSPRAPRPRPGARLHLADLVHARRMSRMRLLLLAGACFSPPPPPPPTPARRPAAASSPASCTRSSAGTMSRRWSPSASGAPSSARRRSGCCR